MVAIPPVPEHCRPYLLMTSSFLGLSVFIILLRTVVSSGGISSTIIVVYEHVLSSTLLFTLAIILERGKRPPVSPQIFCWTFCIGFLQSVLSQLLMTWSLQYITASFQSVALNTIPAVVFVLAVLSRQESFHICGIHGQAKVWGLAVSTAGATLMVLSSDDGSEGLGKIQVLGSIMLGFSILSTSVANLLVEHVSRKYSAQITLSAMMNVSGAIQMLVVGVVTERKPSSWLFSGCLEIFVVIYGGIVVTGLVFYATNWCIHKKGPVFTAAFSPLLIFFSFLLETLISRKMADPWSIVGAVLVIGGLYLLLWGKAYDPNIEKEVDALTGSPCKKPLLQNRD